MDSDIDKPIPRLFLLVVPLLTIALALTAACGGNDDNDSNEDPASPTIEYTVVASSPTEEPDGESPAATVSPTPADGEESSPTPSPEVQATPAGDPQVEVTPVQPFDIRSTEAINVRDGPSTDRGLVTTIFPGETAKVTGEAQGEPVEEDEPMWYQVEISREGQVVQGFLYAPYVARVP